MSNGFPAVVVVVVVCCCFCFVVMLPFCCPISVRFLAMTYVIFAVLSVRLCFPRYRVV